jgi:hypothetical protein
LRRAAGARDLGLDLAPSAKAGIEDPFFREPIESAPIIIEMLRLPAYRLVPIKAQPSEIFEDRNGILVATAPAVDVLNP